MAYQFSDEDKVVNEFSDQNWFGFGVHKVKIGLIEHGETENGKEYVEFTVLGDNEEEDTARVWFTTQKAANYSFNICRQIYVHNAPEAKKDEARDGFDALPDAEAMVAMMNEKLIGGECWFTKYPSPDRTYQAQDGSIKKSIDKNVFGYEPKLRTDLMPKDEQKSALNALEGAEDITGTDAAAGIPGDDDWSK